jgi:hypothetical protein
VDGISARPFCLLSVPFYVEGIVVTQSCILEYIDLLKAQRMMWRTTLLFGLSTFDYTFSHYSGLHWRLPHCSFLRLGPCLFCSTEGTILCLFSTFSVGGSLFLLHSSV